MELLSIILYLFTDFLTSLFQDLRKRVNEAGGPSEDYKVRRRGRDRKNKRVARAKESKYFCFILFCIFALNSRGNIFYVKSQDHHL